MSKEIIAAAVGIFVALISLLGALIATERRISEIRQNWLEGLRKDIGELIAAGSAIYSQSYSKEDLNSANASQARILMRLNPQKHAELITAINNYHDAIAPNGSPSGRATNQSVLDCENGIIAEAQPVIRKVWGKVKRGEPFHYISKIVLVALLLVFLLITVVSLVIKIF